MSKTVFDTRDAASVNLKSPKCLTRCSKCFSICMETSKQWELLLIHSVNDVLIKAAPLVNQTFLQIVDNVTQLTIDDSIVPTRFHKWHCPLEWDPGCSVVTVGLMDWRSPLSLRVVSLARWAGRAVFLESEDVAGQRTNDWQPVMSQKCVSEWQWLSNVSQ